VGGVRVKTILGMLLVLGAGCLSRAPEVPDGVRWEATYSCDSLGVGDRLTVEIEGAWPDSLGPLRLAMPDPGDTLLIVASDSASVAAAEGWVGRRYRLGFVAPRSGRFLVPPAALVAPDGTWHGVTPACEIVVTGRVPENETGELHGLRPMVSLKGFPLLPVALGAGALALAVLAAWGWSRRQRGVDEVPAPPPVPPGIEFREGIDQLLARGLAEKGRMRAFAQELSWVFRRYLGRRCGQPALEATRPEILRWLPHTELSVKDQQAVAAWLAETDGIKFAGERPLLSVAQALVERASEIVKRSEERVDAGEDAS